MSKLVHMSTLLDFELTGFNGCSPPMATHTLIRDYFPTVAIDVDATQVFTEIEVQWGE